jgi:CelD/BcsL family acetyltransferase involved in cellulose biosynthesis
MRFQELGWDEGLARLADQWRELLAATAGDYSLSPEWMHAAASAFGLSSTLRILAAFDGGDVVGIIPFRRSQTRMFGLPLRALDLGGGMLVTYHHEVVARGRHEEILRELLRRDPWHVLRAGSLTMGGPTEAAVTSIAAADGYDLHTFDDEVSPYLVIDRSWEKYLVSKSSNFRYNLKRKEKNLLKAGRVEHRWLTAPGDVEELGRRMLEIEAQSWKVAAGIAVSSREVEQRYYRELLPVLAARGALLANVLYLDGEPIAYTLCSVWNGRVTQMKTTFKEAHGKLSPGAVTIQYAVQRAFDAGAREFDFLGDAQAHKMHWCDASRAHRTYQLFSRRLLARVASFVKNQGRRFVARLGRAKADLQGTRPEEAAQG